MDLVSAELPDQEAFDNLIEEVVGQESSTL